MKNLDVKELGLEELCNKEAQNVNGGAIPLIVVGGLFLVGAAFGVGAGIWWNKRR